jgi:2'-5' RNA ligase
MLRAFIAIELSQELKRQISELQADLKRQAPELRALNWVRPEGIHLTLRFLGDMAEEQIEPLTNMLKAAAASVHEFRLEARGLGGFPTPARARVVWLGLTGEAGAMSALHNLQTSIEQEVVSLGFAAEARVFTPHLTLARVRNRAVSGPLAKLVIKEQDRMVGELFAGSVALIKSELRPSGAVYTSLVEVPFGLQV